MMNTITRTLLIVYLLSANFSTSFAQTPKPLVNFFETVHYSLPHNTTSIDTGDFNNDGFPDIVVADNTLSDPNNNGGSILFGNGRGLLGPSEKLTLNTSGAINALGLADFNGDGIDDLAYITVLKLDVPVFSYNWA